LALTRIHSPALALLRYSAHTKKETVRAPARRCKKGNRTILSCFPIQGADNYKYEEFDVLRKAKLCALDWALTTVP
jgi:hypothetical protein